MHIEHIRQSVGVLKCGRNFRECRRDKITVNPKIFVRCTVHRVHHRPHILKFVKFACCFSVCRIFQIHLSQLENSLSILMTVLLAFLV